MMEIVKDSRKARLVSIERKRTFYLFLNLKISEIHNWAVPFSRRPFVAIYERMDAQ